MYTLIVIDMQPKFDSSQKESTIKNCRTLLRQAQKDKAGILLVEYIDYGETDNRLQNMIRDYSLTKTITKISNDGSVEIRKAIKKYNYPSKLLKVCGVNTDYCVYESVVGLTKNMPRATIEVIGKACNSTWTHKRGLAMLKELSKKSNVKLK